MFDRLLIANRGEIACRIMRTARRLGLRTIAVYSEVDADALHVAMADEALAIGPAAAADSYLRADRIVEAARESGAQAVHPGYGFLAENAEFAEACCAAGLIFVGPPPDAIRAMGSKSEAKALMEKAGVPLVPGYHGRAQSVKALTEAAGRIGYPVLIKPSAGGGGKGMRVVESAGDLTAALEASKREAKAAFGDDRVLLERYLVRPRHVEMQVFADRHGACIHLFERDCSVQRRHQKVLEEAPAPGLPLETRRAMGEAAVAAACSIGYVGAGTVEFLYEAGAKDGPGFYFMEMNTRLQVEHPVTEMVTRLDLVELQLRVAAGDCLPFDQDALALDGHAVEARLYAEDPSAGFLPATGRLRHLRLPQEGPHIRVDTGVRQGDSVTVHYDPMIAKIIAWDADRPAALRRLSAALDSTEVAGLQTNADFLRAVVAHTAFGEADLDTRFIDRHEDALVPSGEDPPGEALILAALGMVLHWRRDAERQAAASADPWSPWNRASGWRLNDKAYDVLRFRDGAAERSVAIRYLRDGGLGLCLEEGEPVTALGALDADGRLSATLDGRRRSALVVRHGLEVTVIARAAGGLGGTYRLALIDPVAAAAAGVGEGGRLTAPMPGRVVTVLVKPGAAVEKGQPLLVLEAMKMEHTITAPSNGAVTALPYSAGDQVEEGVDLLGFEPSQAGV